jgi:hypothetical protein
MESYIVEVLNVLTISYNVTSTDGHVTFHIEQVDGKITSVTLTTSDIASADALNLKASQADFTALASRVTTAEGNITTLGGRMTTAEGNITTLGGRMTTAEGNITTLGGRMTTAEGNITSLGGRVSTNETDIANLQHLYNDLQQSKPVPVTALPETGQQQGVIYRLAGTTSYSDYMWNGSTWVLMATYNNAIDPRPKKASQNLVTSGGVFDNIGALDISELNATENPHTLAQYIDLSAALAAIPTDYQKGGMSIKYVCTSDNKYVRYDYMGTEVSGTPNPFLNPDNWSIHANTILKESPEFIEAKTDGEGKLLESTQIDGSKIFYEDVNVKKTIAAKEISSEKMTLAGAEISFSATVGVNTLTDDPEERLEIKTDYEGKIVSDRGNDGMLREKIGVKTPLIIADKIDSPSINSVELTSETNTIYVERPKFGEIWFEGELPTDTSDERIPTWLTMTFKNSGVSQFKCNCTLAIQGHGSASYAKRGYTLEPYNGRKKSISIKFGDMIAIDSFHLKAYATDSLHCRDMANFNIWRSIIEHLGYPYSKINNIPYGLADEYNKNIINTADAKYAPDGFPCVCYLNGNFLGLYTIKLKKSRQNYAMEKSIKTEIFLDATNTQIGGTSASSLNTQFIHEGWDLKNPKLKNYEEGGEIPDANVLASIERLFGFTSAWDASDPASIEGYDNFIVLPHWLAFVIFEELVYSEDSVGNNLNVVTWDNNHWSVIPYDTDLSYGLHAWNRTLYGPDMMNRFIQYGDIWPTFRSLFNTQIRALWTSLRANGIITFEKVFSAYKEQCSSIPRDIYASDYEKWGTIWENGIPSMEQLAANIAARIEWLDNQWLNNN